MRKRKNPKWVGIPGCHHYAHTQYGTLTRREGVWSWEAPWAYSIIHKSESLVDVLAFIAAWERRGGDRLEHHLEFPAKE